MNSSICGSCYLWGVLQPVPCGYRGPTIKWKVRFASEEQQPREEQNTGCGDLPLPLRLICCWALRRLHHPLVMSSLKWAMTHLPSGSYWGWRDRMCTAQRLRNGLSPALKSMETTGVFSAVRRPPGTTLVTLLGENGLETIRWWM